MLVDPPTNPPPRHVIHEGDHVNPPKKKTKSSPKGEVKGRKTTTWAIKDRKSYICKIIEAKNRQYVNGVKEGSISPETIEPGNEDPQDVVDTLLPFIIHYIDDLKSMVPDPFASIPNPDTWSPHDRETNVFFKNAGLGKTQRAFFNYAAHKFGYSSLKAPEYDTNALDF